MRRRERRSEYAKGRGCASTRGKKFPRTHTRIFTFVLQTHRKPDMMKIEKRKKHPPCGRGDGNRNDVAVVYFRRNGASASAGAGAAPARRSRLIVDYVTTRPAARGRGLASAAVNFVTSAAEVRDALILFHHRASSLSSS